MSNIFFQGGENFSRGGFAPPAPPWLRAWYRGTVYGPGIEESSKNCIIEQSFSFSFICVSSLLQDSAMSATQLCHVFTDIKRY